MGRTCIGLAVLSGIASLALSCGGDCPDYPLRYAGTIDGSLTADVSLNRASSPAGKAAYTGMFTGKGSSVGTNGTISFRVDCSTHQIESGSWQVQDVPVDYPHGYVHGTATSLGAQGTYDCDPSASCTWTGTWDTARQ